MREFTIDGIKYREIDEPLTEGSSIVITRFEGQDIEPTLCVVVDDSDGDDLPYLDRHITGRREATNILDMNKDTYYVVEKVGLDSETSKIHVRLVDEVTYIFRADSHAVEGYFIKFTDSRGRLVAQFPCNKVMSIIVKED